MCVLALDLGATYIKCTRVWPADGIVEPAVRRSFPRFRDNNHPRHREVCADDILVATRNVLDDVLSNGPHPSSLFLCGQMHGFVLVSSTGERLSEFISWQDQRSLEAVPSDCVSPFDILQHRLGTDIVTELGNELRPGSPIATMFSMLLRGALPPDAVPLSLPDFIALHLCGRLAKPATDATNAAAHGALNVATLRWHDEGLRRAGLDGIRWPVVLPSGTALGDFIHEGRRIVVHLPVGDQQAALLGADLTEGELSVNVATGSQVSTIVSQPAHGDWQLRPFTGNRWLRTITHLPAGRALNALIGLLDELAAAQGTPLRDPWPTIERLAAAAPRPLMQADVSFFPSSVGQHGSLLHVTENELHVGPLFRAAFRSMAENYLNAATRIAPQGWRGVVFSGGLIRQSKALQREISSLLGDQSRCATQAEDTLAGLLQLARTTC